MTCRVYRSPTRSTVFNNVTLYLPPPGSILGPISLTSLLQSMVSLESLDKEEEAAEAATTTTKQLSFARLPRCLCLHIQRTGFQSASGVAYKRHERVTFPLYLSMESFLYVKQLCGKGPSTKAIYHLCAVICHLGDIERGHYITYRKLPGGKQFYFTSDADVRPVRSDEVLAANPYILLYERLTADDDASQ